MNASRPEQKNACRHIRIVMTMINDKSLLLYSNPKTAQTKAYRYLGRKNGKLFRSTKRDKKYMIQDPKTHKWVHFGQMGYEDYTKHHDKARRRSYLSRSKKMKGHWKSNKFSANNLAIHVLW